MGTTSEHAAAGDGGRPGRPFVLACGALVRELRAVLDRDGLTGAVDVEYLPAPLHNRPERIVPAIEERLATVDANRQVTRLPGAHCYEFFAGAERFAELHEEELGSFYLTDFLARHFESLIWEGIGIAAHPELRDIYFGSYRRVVLLSQSDDPSVVELGRAAAARLQLDFVHVPTGLSAFATPVRVALGVEAS